jgi:hypothetical protein
MMQVLDEDCSYASQQPITFSQHQLLQGTKCKKREGNKERIIQTSSQRGKGIRCSEAAESAHHQSMRLLHIQRDDKCEDLSHSEFERSIGIHESQSQYRGPHCWINKHVLPKRNVKEVDTYIVHLT